MVAERERSEVELEALESVIREAQEASSSSDLLLFIRRKLSQFNLSEQVEASEIISEAYLRGTSRIRKGESISKPASWLRATALNILRERSRIERNSGLIRDQLKAEITDAPLPSDDKEVELIEIAHKALNLLRREDALAAEIVQLKVIKSLTWKQIKDFLEEDGQDSLSVSAVRKRGIRAIERMREIYNSLSSEDIESTDSNPIQSEFIFESPSDAINDIVIYQRELQKYNQEDFPEQWAKAQYDLAAACFELPQGERSENLEQAIAACQSALQVYTREAFPKHWAKTQTLLGKVFFERIVGDRSENIEHAIVASQSALQVCSRESMPVAWAASMMNLATAYRERIRGDRAQNLEDAIAAYEQSLQVMTREDFPIEWAQSMNDLAETYLQRIRGNRADNLENATFASQQALQVRTRESMPIDWANSMHNLATAYYSWNRGDRAQNIEEAIDAYEQVLQVITRENLPEYWAKTQAILAKAYAERIRGEEISNINLAIQSYERALEVFTREAFPQAWADTKAELVNTYAKKHEYLVRLRQITTEQLGARTDSGGRGILQNQIEEITTELRIIEREIRLAKEAGIPFQSESISLPVDNTEESPQYNSLVDLLQACQGHFILVNV